MADDDTYRSENGWHRFVTIPMSAEATDSYGRRRRCITDRCTIVQPKVQWLVPDRIAPYTCPSWLLVYFYL